MFQDFLLFELRYRLRRPLIYIFFLICLLLVFAATVSDKVQIGDVHAGLHKNAPHVIFSLSLMMSLIGVFMTTALTNTAMLRDFDYRYDGILFATPITKGAYLGGRFAGAFLMALVPFLGVFAGIALGSLSPWVEASRLGAFQWQAYWVAFWLAVVPNTLLMASIVFMLAALFRSSLFSFIGAMGILILYILLLGFTRDLDHELLVLLIDPLAINAHGVLTKYWTVYEKNHQVLSFSGPLLLNRLIWVTVSLGLLALTYFRFSFAAKTSLFGRPKRAEASRAPSPVPTLEHLPPLPRVVRSYGVRAQWRQLWQQAWMEWLGMVKSTPFVLILLFGWINMSVSIPRVAEAYGTGNHPVTYLVVDAIRGSLYLFLVGIILYYSGAIVWRERDAKMNAFFDASPFPSWLPVASKLLALSATVFVVLLSAIAVGMGVQVMSGYPHFEGGVYAREFLAYDFLGFVVLILLSVAVHTLVNHKYLGYFLFLLLLVLLRFGPLALDINSHLLIFGSAPDYIYSDLNRWNPFERGLFWFKAYWGLAGALLGILSVLFWVRGRGMNWSQRWRIARRRLRGSTLGLTVVLLLLWVGSGGFLWYQTQVLHTVSVAEEMERESVAYEQSYRQYQHLPQARITHIDYRIDLYPEARRFRIEADVVARNKTQEAIDQVHFSLPDQMEVDISIPGARIVHLDSILRYQIFQLSTSLAPGDSLRYRVRVDYTTTGIENEVSNTDIVDNGTFLSNYKLMPSIGYQARRELSDARKREQYGLPYRPRMAPLHPTCGHACHNNYLSSDSDWVQIRSEISTTADQIAIAPGTLVREWQTEGRRHFEYRVDRPVLNFYSFISGRYEVARRTWQPTQGRPVEMEVYYHPGHAYNIEKMLQSIEQSLDYYTTHFLPYPHTQARIIEFPRYANFAQAFPGTMPYSESLGFIAQLNEPDAIDMVCYIVAHEMAHQWWAHQVIGAGVQGATMLSETFAQYSALMVMQKRYGRDKMKQFMRYEMDKYLRMRGSESEKELPLMYNENQDYIHYRKGSVVMYALQEYIGEERLNQALRRYAKAVAYQEPPYTHSREALTYLRAATPDSLQYLLHDLFEDIVLYNNQTLRAQYRPLEGGQYEVQLDVRVEKFRADSLGQETLLPHRDYIDIGVFSAEKTAHERYGRPIRLERVQISGRDTSFTLVVDELPYEAGIDPNYLLIDRFPEDNVKVLERLE
ncbi:MAG: M1 family aminopeptidase [Bacteroidota bacterium]